MAVLLALALALVPTQPGTYRRAAPAPDGVHVALFLYLPERERPGSPLVVLLPDLGTTHDVFDLAGEGLARELCARGLSVVTLDWRGTGLSQVPPRDPTLDDLLTLDLPTAANALGPERPLVLLGWGYSGALAYAAAAGLLRARVRGVVALDGVVQLDVPNPIVERLFSGKGALDLSRALAAPAPQRRGNLFDLLWVHPASIDPELSAQVLTDATGPISAPQVAQLHAWMHAGRTTLGGRLYPDLLRDLAAPVLALDGVRDNWTHPEFASPIRDRVPESRLTFRAVDTFEGFREDESHLGLVLGPTSRKELVPLIADFALGEASR